MIWVTQIGYTLSTLLTLTCGRPNASGWQDISSPSASGWQDISSPSATVWQDISSPSALGWQDISSPSTTGWQDISSPSTTGWQDISSPSSSPSFSEKLINSVWNNSSPYNFHDGIVSTDYVSRYHGPIAFPVVLPDGTIADTPEVAAAKAAHLVAVEKAKALWYGPYDDGSYDHHKYKEYESHGTSGHNQNSPLLHDDHSYSSLQTNTTETPLFLHSGYLADSDVIEEAKEAEQEAEKWRK